jgi:hypothetical protein
MAYKAIAVIFHRTEILCCSRVIVKSGSNASLCNVKW